MICVYIALRPTSVAAPQSGLPTFPVTTVGSRSISAKAVSDAMNQSNTCPVQKSSTFITTPACCPCSRRAVYSGRAGGLAGSSQDPDGP